MTAKKTATKKKTAAKKVVKAKTLSPVKESSEELFSKLIERLSEANDFDQLVLLLEAFREDYNQASYDPDVIGGSGLLEFYSGGRFALDNLLSVIRDTVDP